MSGFLSDDAVFAIPNEEVSSEQYEAFSEQLKEDFKNHLPSAVALVNGNVEFYRRLIRLQSESLQAQQENREVSSRMVEEWYKYAEQHLKVSTKWLKAYLPDYKPSKAKEKKPAGRGIPDRLPQRTFFEARAMATAISDGRDLRNWAAIQGVTAMLHDAKGSYKMQTRFEPGALLMGAWGITNNAPEIEHLKNELQALELDALVTFHVCLSGALEKPELDTSIDGIIAAIGRDADARRSKENRALWRGKVWRWLCLFDSLAVFGARPGVWKEPRDAENKRARIEPQKLYSQDALLKIIGQRGTEPGAIENRAVPQEVVLVAGPWARQFRGNREMLAEFGTLRTIASIPRGKPSGAWATCIGLMLQQRWREQAAKCEVQTVKVTRKSADGDSVEKRVLTQEFKPFTRRALLLDTWRSDDDVMKILESDTPRRAKAYWEQAIKILQELEIIGIYRESKPLKAGAYGWQDEWLDQSLDIRPAGDNRKNAIAIGHAAIAAKKRTRKATTKKSVKVA